MSQTQQLNTINEVPEEQNNTPDILALNDSSFDSRNLTSNHEKVEEDEAIMEELERISPSEVKELKNDEQEVNMEGNQGQEEEEEGQPSHHQESEVISGSEEFDIYQNKSKKVHDLINEIDLEENAQLVQKQIDQLDKIEVVKVNIPIKATTQVANYSTYWPFSCCLRMCGRKRRFEQRQSDSTFQHEPAPVGRQSFSFGSPAKRQSVISKSLNVSEVVIKENEAPLVVDNQASRSELNEFKEPYPKRQRITQDSRNFNTISPSKDLVQLNAIIERQERQLDAIKRGGDISLMSQRSMGKRSIQSVNSYRNLINKLHNKKTILDQYYSGPPKYEAIQNPEFVSGKRSSSVSKCDMLNLVSDSGNEKSEIFNFKGKIETQDRIDITKPAAALPFFAQQNTVFQVQPSSQGTNLKSDNSSPAVFLKAQTNQMMKPALDKKEIDLIKSKITLENEQIIHNNTTTASASIFEDVSGEPKFITDALKKKIAANLNYTPVPQNSQIAYSPTSNHQAPPLWDGSLDEQPDEDTIEDLNLPEINLTVLKTLFDNNISVVKDIASAQPSLLMKLCSRMRSTLGFMQKNVRIYAQLEIESPETWRTFLDNESIKISAGKFEAIVLLLQKGSQQLDMVIIDQTKVCQITFTNQEGANTWTDSSSGEEGVLEQRIKDIHEMLNGKKFAVEKKPLFMMKPTDLKEEDLANQNCQIDPFERHKETIIVKNPLAAVFCYYRYYIFQAKYKAIVKFNLNHKAYFTKRDEIIALANKAELTSYFNASILSFVCV